MLSCPIVSSVCKNWCHDCLRDVHWTSHRRRPTVLGTMTQRRLRHGWAPLTVGCQYAPHNITSQGFDKCGGATSNPPGPQAASEVGSRPGRAFVGVGCTKAPSFNDSAELPRSSLSPPPPSSKSFLLPRTCCCLRACVAVCDLFFSPELADSGFGIGC